MPIIGSEPVPFFNWRIGLREPQWLASLRLATMELPWCGSLIPPPRLNPPAERTLSPMRRLFLILSAIIAILAAPSVEVQGAGEHQFTLERNEQGIAVKLDGQFFTQYVTRSGNKPILWPIIGPDGVKMTRDFPMQTVAGESRDHQHHRSLWFAYAKMNGIDFWSESPKSGQIRHREFTAAESGPVARISAVDDWLAPDGRRVCVEQRSFIFRAAGSQRSIDCNFRLTSKDEIVDIGDTKEGMFAMRVADWLKVDPPGKGHIVNSEGQTDAAAWGRRASWVDYHAPHDGRVLGIAILNHPSSFRYPTYWHVRTYGLFAANPYGVKEFTGKKTGDGSMTLDQGQSLGFRYRVILHEGDERQSHIAEEFAEYARENVDDASSK